uniref:Uncharacterized protein n=1 Tax=Coccidioides posadasii RMSCC 3488 TaxID=454284 RepID=A0A0J6FUF0_COCPO|nr:hypothetical protein CPAG_09314 [Coccidioides posadasii RMSCC 3488]
MHDLARHARLRRFPISSAADDTVIRKRQKGCRRERPEYGLQGMSRKNLKRQSAQLFLCLHPFNILEDRIAVVPSFQENSLNGTPENEWAHDACPSTKILVKLDQEGLPC